MTTLPQRRGPKAKVVTEQEQMFLKAVGRCLRKWRYERGYKSHEVFAFKAGIARAQYLSYEHGKNIQLLSLLRLLENLELTPVQFFSSVDNENKSTT
jgi:transcriptional regulator with XRE-family HTH domain